MTKATQAQVRFVGVGNMGGAILRGLLATPELRQQYEFAVAQSPSGTAAALAQEYGLAVQELPEAFAQADLLVLGVKPHQILDLLTEHGSLLRPGTIVISVAAGVTLAQLQTAVPAHVRVIRAMPNTPALVGKGVTLLSGGARMTAGEVAQVAELFRAVGTVHEISEAQQNAATAIAGSGPAYVFYLAETLIHAGMEQGLPEALVRELVRETVAGAAVLQEQSAHSPRELRASVTSPQGMTQAATDSFDSQELPRIVAAGIGAAVRRAQELAGDADEGAAPANQA